MSSPSPGVPSSPRWLLADPVVRVGLTLFGFAWVVRARAAAAPEGLAGTLASWSDPLLLATTLFALLWRRGRLESPRERRFWLLLALGWAFWLAVEFVYFFELSLPALSASFATDVLYVLFYLVFALAIDLRPDRATRHSLALVRRRLESIAVVVAVFGLMFYFALVVLPEPLGLSLSFVSRDQGLTRILLVRCSLDLFLWVRLAAATLSTVGRWRRLYGLLAAFALLLAVRDALVMLRYEGLIRLELDGLVWELFLLIPGALVLCAARLRHRSDGAPPPSVEVVERDVSRVIPLAPYALLVPIVHFLLYPLGLLEPASRSVREVFSLLYVLVVGALAVVHQLVLEKDRRQALDSLHREIDERKRINRELELRHAEMEQFNYTISHELKTPLVTIGGFVGLLERQLEGRVEASVLDDLRKIRLAGGRMMRLMQELLELSRVGWKIAPVERVDVASLVEQARGELEVTLASRGARFVVETPFPPVRADPARIVDVLKNLIDNAVKFCPEDRAPAVRVGARLEESLVVVYVADNGRGIEPRYHDKVFGIFERLDRRAEGSGVGLALVKRVVEEHGGRVWVESDGAGQGATFCFSLQRSQASTGSRAP